MIYLNESVINRTVKSNSCQFEILVNSRVEKHRPHEIERERQVDFKMGNHFSNYDLVVEKIF